MGTEKCDMKCYLDMHSDGCGHYTQVVWRNTREVGCAVARNGSDDFLVCRYWPSGNWMGQVPF